MATRKPPPPALMAAIAAEDWTRALRLASRLPYLGPHKVAIERGCTANERPEFYKALGWDTDELVQAGIAALKERFL